MLIKTPDDALTIRKMKKLCDDFEVTSNDTDVLRFWFDGKMYAVTDMDFDGALYYRMVDFDQFGHAVVKDEDNE